MQNTIGPNFGLYEILYECPTRAKDGHRLYHVRCSQCGWESDVLLSQVRKARTCCHRGVDGKYKHYQTRWRNKRIGDIFNGMKARCYNRFCKSYPKYGGKGIQISEEWLDNPNLFEEWSLHNGYSDGLTIDRIDSTSDYSAENCRWVSALSNSRYKSTTNTYEVDGEAHTGREWSSICQLGPNTINTIAR